ncbi:MAG: M15 family metallopeptidase [Helicobacteraceae bacterium]|jgi:hypothetical protein|nr:M15 family metallopeptidase [Helicobacteraceae bacterium]
MRRRDFLALSALATLSGCAAGNLARNADFFDNEFLAFRPREPKKSDLKPDLKTEQNLSADDLAMEDGGNLAPIDRLELLRKPADLPPLIAEADELQTLKSLRERLARVQNQIGFANFNIISFDGAASVAKMSPAIGEFTRAEFDYFEKLFARDAREYGFFGEKVTHKLTQMIPSKEIFKVPHTGHFLYKGRAAEVYERVRKDVGDSLFLTSGARGVPKQMYLFLTKALACGGNLSEASRSLAPAGYSYHGVGDFDVGKKGFGEKNFTQEFAQTDEYQKLMRLGYVAIRYPISNPFGVYFEPWHIEVTAI